MICSRMSRLSFMKDLK